MKINNWLVALALVMPACESGSGDDTADTDNATGGETTMDTPTGGEDESQTPPEGADAVEAWLAEGHYKSWACEGAAHDPVPPSPHGKNRICSNNLISSHPADGGEYPVGAAAVKELYDEAGANVVGIAVYRHTKAGMTGDTWYWYERVPLGADAPHDPVTGVVADGDGSSGPAMTICVGCHSAAGSDDAHGGHDYVYTQVM